MDRHRAQPGVAGRHESPATLALRGGELLLLVARRHAATLRLDPYLQEVHRLRARWIELAVLDARSRAHQLDVAGTDHRSVPHAVLVLERPVEDVREDLHVAVEVRAEPLSGLHAVIVEDAQRAKAHVPGIAVVGERERVAAVEPFDARVAAITCASDRDHRGCLPGGIERVGWTG